MGIWGWCGGVEEGEGRGRDGCREKRTKEEPSRRRRVEERERGWDGDVDVDVDVDGSQGRREEGRRKRKQWWAKRRGSHRSHRSHTCATATPFSHCVTPARSPSLARNETKRSEPVISAARRRQQRKGCLSSGSSHCSPRRSVLSCRGSTPPTGARTWRRNGTPTKRLSGRASGWRASEYATSRRSHARSRARHPPGRVGRMSTSMNSCPHCSPIAGKVDERNGEERNWH